MDGMPVIRRKGETRVDLPPEAQVDAHFAIAGSQRLFLRELTSPQAGLAYLGHRIIENPADLRSHVQRILLLIDREDASALQGAVIDLFIVLGDKGLALKQRLLAQAAPLLSRTAAAFLQRSLESGLRPWDNTVARVRGSLLSLGYSGSHEVVRRLDRGTVSAYADALEEARACLEYGQVEEARDVLEKALRADPADAAVAAELLELYRHAREEERQEAMRDYLLQTLGRLPEGWARLH